MRPELTTGSTELQRPPSLPDHLDLFGYELPPPPGETSPITLSYANNTLAGVGADGGRERTATAAIGTGFLMPSTPPQSHGRELLISSQANSPMQNLPNPFLGETLKMQLYQSIS